MPFRFLPREGLWLAIKRGIDITVSAAGLLVLFPFFLVLALLIKYTSKGPVLFSQRRVGRNGVQFTMYKFRTMHQRAEEVLSQRPRLMEWDGPVFRVRNDPRVTSVGRLMRRYCIDELPQLFNVLRGDMSLVGPRPHLPEEVARYKPWHHQRLQCRPGLTCLWQIGDRHQIPTDEWIRMDLQYLSQWSLWLDLRILAKTFQVILTGKGA
jgi:exopolysaccharide biosynthesis polyprenyl glycosylphosphotransferase